MYENKFMYDNNFALRISKLRTQKGVSARDMSLSIGQNAGYINNIETGKALPSMTSFFYICEYLGITPQEFTEEWIPELVDEDSNLLLADAEQPKELSKLISDLKKLNKRQLENIADIVNDLANGNRR